MTVAYQIKIGNQTASSQPAENERLLLSLLVRLDMSGAGGCCELRFGDPETTLPMHGDAVNVELDTGAGKHRVFTGTVDCTTVDTTGLTVTAYDGLRQLAALEVDAVYQDSNVDFVIKDLIGRANLKTGRIAKGFKLATLNLKHHPNALSHLLQLADWCGADLFTDGEGKVHFATAAEHGAEYRFQFDENVRSVDLRAVPPLYDSVEVVGEGAASSQGSDKYYWLAKDLSGVSSKAAIDGKGKVSAGKSGKKPRRLVIGAVRSGEAAAKVAEAHMQALASRWLRGSVEVFGESKIIPGDTVKLQGLPKGHALAALLQDSHKLRVRAVSHRLSRNSGLTTRLEF